MSKQRIMVIDDEPDFTLTIRLNLEATGEYEVREINSAADALPAARDFHPDLVLLDVMMPGLDGGDVLAQFKDDTRLRATPIVFVSAAVLKEEVDAQGGLIGGRPFLPKPVPIDTLLTCVRQNLPVAPPA